MLFSSYGFLLVFLPAAILIGSLVDRDPRLRTWVLLALSLVFYSYWDVRFLPLMIVSIGANWWAAGRYKATGQYGYISGAIVANLLVLGFFKYTNFFADSFATLLGQGFEPLPLVLPLGISFFTFHHIMYLVDLGRGRAPLYSFDRYALYICFFPQAIAGPIARWSEVIDQFGQRIYSPGWERRWALGATFIIVGLLQKVLLADPIGQAIESVYADALTKPVEYGRAWVALAFVFQVFFDFAGYSDIAIGLALIFGVQLPLNFDAPFRATSMTDFWQRWHMTLGRFLRDYVFAPLSNLSIGGRQYRTTRLLVALVLTMALCGLWHGPGWTYVLWGVSQGVALVFAVMWRRYLPSPPALIGWAATVSYFIVTGVLFRAGSLEAAWRIYEGLMVAPPLQFQGRNTLIAAMIVAFLLPASHEICRRLTTAPRIPIAAALSVLAVIVLVYIGDDSNTRFVYFQF